MKKVLFVATVVKTHIMEFHIPYLEMFKKMGWNTSVAARNDYDDLDECQIPFCDMFFNIPFERSPMKPSNIKAYKMLKKIIDDGDFDIVHCHTPVGAMLARLAARKARKKGTRVIYTAHGFHFYKGAPKLNWILFYPVEKWLSRHTDDLITINKEDFERAKKFKAKKVHYVRGVGVNSSKFRSCKGQGKEIRDEFGIKETDFVILSVGEVNKNKNHRATIEAVAKIADTSVYYVVCGQGPLIDEHKHLAETLGVGNRVIFVGYRNDVSKFYDAADAFVFPSFREGLSVAMMEAMASGLPIICSKIRGNVDLVEDGVGGYLCPPSDIDAIAGGLVNLISNSEMRDKMGQANREQIKKFDLSVVVDQMTKIYINESELT